MTTTKPRVPWGRLSLLVMVLSGLALALFVPATHVHAATFAYSEGSAVQESQWDNIDAPPLIYKDNTGDLWMIYGDGGNNWHRWEAPASHPTMDNLSQQFDAQQPSNMTHSSCNDDRAWIDRGWYDPSTGIVYATVHIEYCYRNGNVQNWDHTRRIGLVQSSDNGATWSYDGDIVTPSTTWPSGAASTWGDGDSSLLVDSHSGYFYLFYNFGYADSSDHWLSGGVGVARCPLSSKMAPNCWTKYANGAWSQNALGGQESAISGLQGCGICAYQWNSYLNEYVAMGNGGISTATDLSSQNWSVLDGTGASIGSTWYQWVVDDNTQDTNVVGQHFRFYTASNDHDGGTSYYEFTLGSSGSNSQASTGFSSTQGSNQWAYQYSTNGEQSFQNGSWDGADNVWVGPGGYTGWCDVGQNWQIPNTSCDAARVWQAPQAGTVTLSSNGPISVQAACGGSNNGTQIRILKNGSQIWPDSGWQAIAHGQSYSFPSGVTTTVNANDQIQFVVTHTGSDNYCDSTTWDQVVSYSTSQASTGFSSTQGSSQWYYQYSTNGEQSFQNNSWDSTDSAWVDPNGYSDYCNIWQNTQHPGTSCDSIRVWQAPNSGTVTVGANGSVSVTNSCSGNTSGVNIRILKNGTQIWPASGWQNIANGGSYSFPSGVSTSVAAGDRLQFVDAHVGSVNYCDTTTWDQIVSYS